ncbi:MAG: flagellar FliJ family protein [Planctomycetes bacterium]|nr:flagellar FliJ family protein [Planctomycetota bacterium]
MAGRFAFRFETLLRLRKQREDERKRVVAARLRRISELMERRNNLLSAIDGQTDSLRSALRGGAVDVDQVRWGRHWLTHLRRGVLDTDAELSGQRAMLAQERATLVEARKDTEVLARLRERRLEAWSAEAARREQIESDEMNTLRFAHASLTESEDRS